MSRLLLDTSAYVAQGLTIVTLNGDFDLIPQVLVRRFEPPSPVPPP